MPALSLNSSVRRIRRIAYIIQSIEGLTLGASMFVWGALYYSQLGRVGAAGAAMSMTALLIAIDHIACMFLEVPTGAIGDALGRKKSVALSYVFKLFSLLFLAFVPFATSMSQLLFFGVANVVTFAVSFTFMSGTFTAWCVDSLREADSDVGYEHVISPSYTMRFAGMLVGGAVSIYAYVSDVPHLVFLASAALCGFAVVYCLTVMDGGEGERYLDWSQASVLAAGRRMGEIVTQAVLIFKKTPALFAAVGIYASFMVVLNLVEYYWPIYLQSTTAEAAQLVPWIGLAVVTRFSSMAGSQTLSSFTQWKMKSGMAKLGNSTLRRSFVGFAVCGALPIVFFSLGARLNIEQSFGWLVAVVVAILFARGVIAPCFDTLVNNYIPDTHASERATVLSFGSLLRSLLMIVLAIPAGGSSGAETTKNWVIPAVILLVIATLANRVLRRADQSGSNSDATSQERIGHA